MRKTAKLIRAKLKEVGISRLDVSVKCNSDYTIHCFNKTKKMSHENLISIVASVYHQKDHHWLCVMVNHHWLPMKKPLPSPPTRIEQ
jgi:hypothetical protein